MSAAGVQNSTIITSAKTSHGVTTQGHMACVSRSWRLLSLQDKQPITRNIFGKISDDCNFRIFKENSKKIPVLQYICNLATSNKNNPTFHLALMASPATHLAGGHDTRRHIVGKLSTVHPSTPQAVTVLTRRERKVVIWLTSRGWHDNTEDVRLGFT